jgi:menaquinone-dependent protoporphyrinogen oxidase
MREALAAARGAGLLGGGTFIARRPGERRAAVHWRFAMSKLAVLYATTEGQTAKIASHIANRLREHGHEVTLHHVDALEGFEPSRFDGILIGGSIHEGRYQRYLERWLKDNHAQLALRPTALFTVCLAIESVLEQERADARSFPSQLTERTRFLPGQSAIFAGALKYTEYSWLKRALMKQIAKREGASQDTSCDHEYTSWPAVDAFTDGFEAYVQKATPSAAVA